MVRKKSRSKAVANKAEQSIIEAKPGAVAPAYIDQGQSRGSENVTTEDLVIPRLEIVQALSPCKDKNEGAYIEGCEEGQLFTYDGEGVMRSLNMDSHQWAPVLDFKISHPHLQASQMWIVGDSEQEILAIEMP